MRLLFLYIELYPDVKELLQTPYLSHYAGQEKNKGEVVRKSSRHCTLCRKKRYKKDLKVYLRLNHRYTKTKKLKSICLS
ncbi:hypothetical protein TTE2026 [Caldanaerobacter subterraneus subsp. tengcongensis MB4]|uniref:Uncharacterized protein n=1 Tax=Caldanaerobacter subterraneus subsp. tengcongensis (strain DSM 15242 / JCM 11007 / NBRC 100824 / MB4) TaxID=273068 RepID=Q8R8H3_CALS4|nr:hypothetical protein TTE2026 [Caldanaerobacter subterraneus subsp. tengcongensis MB4]